MREKERTLLDPWGGSVDRESVAVTTRVSFCVRRCPSTRNAIRPRERGSKDKLYRHSHGEGEHGGGGGGGGSGDCEGVVSGVFFIPGKNTNWLLRHYISSD